MMNKGVQVKINEPAITPDFSGAVPETFKEQLYRLTENYILLKDALVNTDAVKAAEAASALIKKLETVDIQLAEGEAHDFWMAQMKNIHAHAQKIETSRKIEVQRKEFDFLSQAMIQTLQAFGTGGHAYYIQYCPMAIDDQGASWLSEEAQIRNPFFGDKMLKCGVVKGKVQ